MSKSNDLTSFAVDGFIAEPGCKNPHLFSSPAWMAHALGEHFKTTGRTMPSDVCMSRGYSLRIRDMVFKWVDQPDMDADGPFVRVR